jgi:transcriptional regulator with PAS, ATPase and Fis domain
MFEVPIGTSLEDAERHLVLSTLAQVNGNRTLAAKVLNISIKTLYTRIKEYGVEKLEQYD